MAPGYVGFVAHRQLARIDGLEHKAVDEVARGRAISDHLHEPWNKMAAVVETAGCAAGVLTMIISPIRYLN